MIKSILRIMFCFIALSLMWTGAEYIFEGGVHTSAVDGVVCGILAAYVEARMDGGSE